MDTIINNIYIKNNFPSNERLYKLVQKDNNDITRNDIKSFLDKQKEYQILKVQHNIKPNGRLVAFHFNEIWQMDIFVLQKYEKQNKGYSYILAVVDIFTRKAFVEPIKNKTSEDCSIALQNIIKINGIPRVIMSDNDKAYEGKEFNNILNRYNIIINENVIGDHNALGIIDRFARTLKTILSHKFINEQNHIWINDIQEIVNVYNDSPNRALLNLTPNEASMDENNDFIYSLNLVKSKENKTISDLSNGDNVRIKISGIFTKGTEPRWSDETYKVKKVQGTTITIDDDRKFKRTNLIKVSEVDNSNKKNIIKTATRNHKITLQNKRDDINESNIIDIPRVRKQREIFNI